MTALLFALALATPPATVPVYIIQPGGTFEDQALKDRRDSTTDLRRALPDTVRVVDVADDATITIEVLERGYVATGHHARMPYGRIAAETMPQIVVVLRTGTYETRIIGKGGTAAFGGWARAAEHAAKQIDQWIKANRSKL